ARDLLHEGSGDVLRLDRVFADGRPATDLAQLFERRLVEWSDRQSVHLLESVQSLREIIAITSVDGSGRKPGSVEQHLGLQDVLVERRRLLLRRLRRLVDGRLMTVRCRGRVMMARR